MRSSPRSIGSKMRSHRRAVEQLGRRADHRRFEREAEALTAPQRAWKEALALAEQHEAIELADLVRTGKDAGRDIAPEIVPIGGHWLNGIDPDLDPRGTELYERIMRRAAPTLADDIKVRRCALWRELARLGVGTIPHEPAIQYRGVDPITDEAAVESIGAMTRPDLVRLSRARAGGEGVIGM